MLPNMYEIINVLINHVRWVLHEIICIIGANYYLKGICRRRDLLSKQQL